MADNDIKIAVLGGGSFGTAVANMIAGNGHSTSLWMRDEENARRCREDRENARYLPGYKLCPRLTISSNMEAALTGAELVFFSVPSKAFRQVCQQAAPFIAANTMVVSTAKGIEGESFKLMSDVLQEELKQPRVGVISGPNLAREVARRELTATVIASPDSALCETVQTLLSTDAFRVYSNSDMFGVELAGALKNIYAITAGVASAMNLGQNTISMLITRSLAEMTRFAARLGADPMTFIGLSGVGDLFVTCTSPLSRNYRIGQALGQGKSLDQAIEEVGQVAEGVNTTRTVKLKADELGIYMPLASGLYEVMFDGASIDQVVKGMMVSAHAEDVEFRIQ
ncbi:MAG TPA: NAD(P)H-dependent glycerol-3-phosphate dehydrogenase [Porticoccaceae bacterium]|nr:NAD(P)H-dependent glycerol-3-phosphate dehydrogenase [Porticoccaceae bacterium]HCO60718.1 NAD(P)H-dependent glycerol-3-phosphate dehydrogenase [Porticoccaceae bacterium]